MPRKKTDAEFRKEVFELVGDEYTVIDKYINTKTKIRIKHNKCGTVYYAWPTTFLQGISYCPCERNRKSKEKFKAQFEQKFFNLVGNEYTILTPYEKANIPIKLRHNKCGYVYSIQPRCFLRGSRCAYCANNIRLTTEQFKQRVQKIVGNEYTVLGEYINSDTKIKIRHNKCNYTYEVRPHNFLTGFRCPNCAHNMKLTTEQFKQRVQAQVGDEYTVLGKYINNHTKIKIRHNLCGNVDEVIPHVFMRGGRCKKCSYKEKGRQHRLTQDEFVKKLRQVHGNHYTVLEKYQIGTRKIKIQCNICGNIFERTPRSLLRGAGCPTCARQSFFTKRAKNINQFKQEVKQLVGQEYSVFGKYQGTNNKIKMKHNKCGHVYEVTPSHFLDGNRCPWCNKHTHMSQGEKLIIKELKKMNYAKDVHYKYGYILPNRLHLDFWFPNRNIAIEYDGAQHFHKSHIFVNKTYGDTPESVFQAQQERDQRKNQYCAEHNIKLIRIPYTIKTPQAIFKILEKEIGYNK